MQLRHAAALARHTFGRCCTKVSSIAVKAWQLCISHEGQSSCHTSLTSQQKPNISACIHAPSSETFSIFVACMASRGGRPVTHHRHPADLIQYRKMLNRFCHCTAFMRSQRPDFGIALWLHLFACTWRESFRLSSPFSDASRWHDGTQPAGASAWCCDTMWHQVVWHKPFRTSFEMLAKAYKLPRAVGSKQCSHLSHWLQQYWHMHGVSCTDAGEQRYKTFGGK